MSVRKQIREALGMTQRDMAERLGCVQSAVSHYELGNRGIDIVVARKYLALAREAGLSTTLDDIFGPPEEQGTSSGDSIGAIVPQSDRQLASIVVPGVDA